MKALNEMCKYSYLKPSIIIVFLHTALGQRQNAGWLALLLDPPVVLPHTKRWGCRYFASL